MDALVTTAWLADELGAGDLRIVDATWVLPDAHRDPAAEYRAAHIPGAVFLDLAAVVDTQTSLPMMLPMAARFAEAMAALGLGDGTRIVLYDNSPLHSAARAWFLLRSFGVRDVAILDGGFAKWRAEGRPVASGGETPSPSPRSASFDASGVRTLAQMRANLASGGEQVIDARSPARFSGEEPEPRPDIASGHIPGARNLHYAKLFNADGTWKRDMDLCAAFADAGVDPERPMAMTCGSGVTASALAFAAHLLGRNAAVYDGSWAEWGADPATPKETGNA